MSSQILEDSLGNTGILAELLKIKFVRRLGGFFRCDSGDKGYFAHLQWEPQNVKFIHCACKFYQVLLSEEVGRKFLRDDRRGKVFEEVTKELSTTIRFIKSSQSSSPSPPSKLFNRITIQRTMTREYFAILGKIFKEGSNAGYLEGLGIFGLIKDLPAHPQLDYLSRVILSNLDYSDGLASSVSAVLLTSAASSARSSSLRLHVINILRSIMLRLMTKSHPSNSNSNSKTNDFTWGINLLVLCVGRAGKAAGRGSEEVRRSSLSVLYEASRHPPFLDKIVPAVRDLVTKECKESNESTEGIY